MSVPLNEKFSIILSLIKTPGLLSALISFKHSGYLVDTGWIKSFVKKQPLDKDDNPVPWITLPCIEFLKDRINNKITVFEFGAGNSTLFFAGRANKIVSVEHNQYWFDKIKNILPLNTELIFHDVNSEYYTIPAVTQQKYDIIFVDAEKRNECLVNSIRSLTDSGVLILDDSEREEYGYSVNFIKEKGFKELVFWGISPGYSYTKSTTIFYRTQNCLNI
ncbi:MAG: hypothetical protein R6W90_06105 [Ignavibacteriaceae bacterium]